MTAEDSVLCREAKPGMLYRYRLDPAPAGKPQRSGQFRRQYLTRCIWLDRLFSKTFANLVR